jgi:hypothetical protein
MSEDHAPVCPSPSRTGHAAAPAVLAPVCPSPSRTGHAAAPAVLAPVCPSPSRTGHAAAPAVLAERGQRGGGPSLDELGALARSAHLADRAFANGALRLHYARHPGERDATRAAYAAAREAAGQHHAPLRLALREGRLRLRPALEALAPQDRDTWVEELLDLAHPPLDEAVLPNELTPFVPSGVEELLFALDGAAPGPSDTVVDLGAGNGKVVLLAHLLTGARAHGIELDEALVAQGRDAAAALGLGGVTFDVADARTAALPEARVFYLYSPFKGAVLDEVMARLEARAQERELVVCCSPSAAPWLVAQPGERSWCVVHRSRVTP